MKHFATVLFLSRFIARATHRGSRVTAAGAGFDAVTVPAPYGQGKITESHTAGGVPLRLAFFAVASAGLARFAPGATRWVEPSRSSAKHSPEPQSFGLTESTPWSMFPHALRSLSLHGEPNLSHTGAIVQYFS